MVVCWCRGPTCHAAAPPHVQWSTWRPSIPCRCPPSRAPARRSTPPYMILNRCKDVVIRLCQLGVDLQPGARTFRGGLAAGRSKAEEPHLRKEQVSWQVRARRHMQWVRARRHLQWVRARRHMQWVRMLWGHPPVCARACMHAPCSTWAHARKCISTYAHARALGMIEPGMTKSLTHARLYARARSSAHPCCHLQSIRQACTERFCAAVCARHARECAHASLQGWDEVVPNAHAPMPFAWDQPMGQHVVQAIAHASGADMQHIAQQVRARHSCACLRARLCVCGDCRRAFVCARLYAH